MRKDKVPCGINEPNIWVYLNSMFGIMEDNVVCNIWLFVTVDKCTITRYLVKLCIYKLMIMQINAVLYDRWKNPGDNAFFKGCTGFFGNKCSTRSFR